MNKRVQLLSLFCFLIFINSFTLGCYNHSEGLFCNVVLGEQNSFDCESVDDEDTFDLKFLFDTAYLQISQNLISLLFYQKNSNLSRVRFLQSYLVRAPPRNFYY